MSNWVGKTLGKVQIEALLGRGGVAEVYLGTHLTLERKVAVKLLRNLNEDNPDVLARFQREARVIARLRHPNIVQVHDFDSVDNDPYLVMEYIAGPSLSQYLKHLHKKHERLPQTQVLRFMDALANALQYAHRNGVVHRDIKPGNILLISPSGPVELGKPLPEDVEPILTDFGLVRFLDANRETTTGRISGTPAYMSPEQARGETADGRTDVYSLGIVLYEMLAGHVPFDGDTTVSILLKQVNQPPPPIPGISPLIENVLNRALAKDPKDRLQTPPEFANAFRAAVDMRSDHTTVRAVPLPRALAALQPEQPPVARPHWIRLGILAATALALGGFLLFNVLPASPPASPTDAIPSQTRAITSVTDTALPPSQTATGTAIIAVTGGPAGVLHFQNGDGIADRAILRVRSMPPPPAGSQYELWLSDGDDRISLGAFSPDPSGMGELTFTEPAGANLLARYDQLEITIESESDPDPRASDLIAYSFSLPAESMQHVRYLLAGFAGTPTKIGLIPGLRGDLLQIYELVREMGAAFASEDDITTRAKAENALNLLVGARSADFKDWDGDGRVLERTGSYGLMLNGNSFGYIRSVYAETDYIVTAPGSTQYMVENGEVVKTCTQNLALWATLLRDRLVTILTSTSGTEVPDAVQEALLLTEQMLNGLDGDGDGVVETSPGECGAEAASEYAYSMANMPILPVSIAYQLTVVADPAYIPPTRVREGSGNDGAPQGGPVSTLVVENPPQPQPTDEPPQPTDEPPPAQTEDPNPPRETRPPKDTKVPKDNQQP